MSKLSTIPPVGLMVIVVILSLSCKLPLIFNNRLKNNYIKLGNCR